MATTPTRAPLLLIAVLGVLLTGATATVLIRAGKDSALVLSSTGSVASLFGLLLVVVELLAIRGVAEATKQAVQDTQTSIKATISLADISRAVRSVEQVQAYAGAKKYELAHMRLQDVRGLLVQLRDNPQVSTGLKPKEYRELLSSVGVDLSSLYDSAHDPSASFDSHLLHQNMERLVTVLVSFENQLRFNRSQTNG